jgi:hypothetical protein
MAALYELSEIATENKKIKLLCPKYENCGKFYYKTFLLCTISELSYRNANDESLLVVYLPWFNVFKQYKKKNLLPIQIENDIQIGKPIFIFVKFEYYIGVVVSPTEVRDAFQQKHIISSPDHVLSVGNNLGLLRNNVGLLF